MANQSSSKSLEIVDFIDPNMWPLDSAPQMLDDQWIQDLSKTDSFNDPYTITDLSSIFPPALSFPTGDAAINTIDPFALHQTQLPIPLEASPPTFSTSSASPADSHSNHSPLGVTEDPAFDPASESSSDEDIDDFAPVRKAPSGKVRGGARGKRAATKAKPYPRVSDVVRDAPHKNELGLSGGKKGPATTELKGSIRTADADDDDWRPTLEEYQKMSSREKRQLRNKISARNFRVRRKEYIATLEGEVATRDKQIEVYREELNTTKSENSELRKEIERLRQSILEGRGLSAAGDKSADSTVLSNANGKTLRSSRSVMSKTNRNKDLPATGSTRGFWGTPMSASTPVHTTLLPELDLVATLSGKQPKLPSPAPLQENINPLLNSMPAVKESQPTSPLSGFEGFADMNSFTYKTLEAYRMQLWQKMAREAGAANRGLPSPSSPPVSLAAANAAVGPRYFNSPSSKPIKTEEGSPTPIQSAVASTLTQGIVNKLGSAFWDAFSGSKPAPINNGPIKGFASQASTSTVDVEKVRKVLEGKAVLQVVDVDRDMQALEDGMKAVSLIAARQTPQMKPAKLESLEDNMKNMSLNRQTKNCVPSAAFGIFTQPLRTGHAPGSITPAHVSHAVAAQH